MRRVRIIAAITILAIVGLTGLSLLLPSPAQTPPDIFHKQLMVTLLIGLTHFGAALFFILCLPNFKAELRKAYVAICAGMITLGVSQFMYPIFAYMGVQNPNWYIAPSIVAILADLLILWGVKGFARLLYITPMMLSWLVVIGVTALVSFLSVFLPHYPSFIPEKALDLSQALYVVSIVMLLFTSSLMILIKRSTGHAYVAATTWFIVAQLSAAVSLIFLFVANMIDPALLSWLKVPATTPLAFVGMFSMAAGYAFNKIGPYGESVGVLHREVTLVDVIEYLASFASNPSSIDPILDDMRVITSSQQAGQKLSAAEEAKLAATCRNLQDYLINRETLRQFDAETIRKSVSRHFNLDPSPNSAFWQKLGAK